MRILFSKDASSREIGEVLSQAKELAGFPADVALESCGGMLMLRVLSNGDNIDPRRFEILPGVESVQVDETICKLAGRGEGTNRLVVDIPFAGAKIGSEQFVVMAGPCAVENEADLLATAKFVKKCGAKFLRAGAFKPRTSPYSFQGMGEEGLRILGRVRAEAGIGVITEAMEPSTVGKVGEIADIIQVGSRNMQNFPLLRETGRQPKPVLLKRGMSATLEEWLSAAEYILAEGNPNVILCERGIRTFSRHSRHTIDLGVIPVIRERSNLPVIVDPSHSTGLSSRVPAVSKAVVAIGADGLLIEVHPEPCRALSDGFQAINLEDFETLMAEMRRVAEAVERVIRES